MIHSAEFIPPLIGGFLDQTREYAVICTDPEGAVVAWRGAAELIFGYSQEEALGMSLSRLFTREDQARGLDRHELEVARSNARSEDDRWHVRKDGTRIWVTGSIDAIRDPGGELLGFVKVMRDRTDLRTQQEAADKQLAACLAGRDRTRAFLRTLGHELRNTLAPLQSAGHIVQRTNQDPRAAKAVEIMFGQLDALRRLADDLMDASRFDTGKIRMELQPGDLAAVVRDASLGFQEAAAHKGVKLQALLPPGPLPVALDVQRFQQVLLNLFGNALKYTPAGGSIWAKATLEDGEVVLRIEDTGIGIDAQTLPRIFELFTREAGAADLEPGGLGIGLAVVREIVELHGGSVQARSAGRGKGAEFTVRLPAAVPHPNRQASITP